MLRLCFRRAHDDGAFVEFATVRSLDDARDALASTVDIEPRHGDLVRVVGGRTDRLYVYSPRASSFVEVPRDGAPWAQLWEGDAADAVEMLQRCAHVDRRRLVLAACDCAETTLRYVPAEEERPRIAIETARRWVRGEAGVEDVRRAADAAWTAYVDAAASGAARASGAASASDAATRAATFDAATRAAAFASYAASYAAVVWLSARTSSLRSMAPLVRRHIPLSVLACAIVGAGDPLPLRFDTAVAEVL